MGTVSTFCMLLVVECKYKLKQRGVLVATYGDIGYAALGRTGQVVVNVALVVAQTGFGVACTYYYLFIKPRSLIASLISGLFFSLLIPLIFILKIIMPL